MKTIYMFTGIAIVAFLAGMVVWNQTKIQTQAEPGTQPGAYTISPQTSVTPEISEKELLNVTQYQRKEIVMDQQPPMQIDATKTYIAILKTTKGDIQIKLNADKTPITANNFIALSRLGFYYQTIFHRVINEFMIQGGDPKGNGTGDPGYKFDDEKFDGDYTRGTVAMANSGPDTNGSQFFIMHQDKPLPKNYVIFGTVIQGMDVVDSIATAPVDLSVSGEMSKPKDPVKIENIQIVEK